MSPLLDQATVETLFELERNGNQGFISEIVASFRETATREIDQIGAALNSGDMARIERGGHTLKSSAANLGATELSRICAALERAAHDSRKDQTREHFAEVKKAYVLIQPELDGLLTR